MFLQGGYPWRGNRTFTKSPDPLVYYERSILRLEWTNQHACGSDPTTHCTMVLQYACDDSLPGVRDGYPSGGLTPSPTNGRVYDPPYMEAKFTTNNKDGTTTISQGTKDNVEFGMHENYDYYLSCVNRERNKGNYFKIKSVLIAIFIISYT